MTARRAGLFTSASGLRFAIPPIAAVAQGLLAYFLPNLPVPSDPVMAMLVGVFVAYIVGYAYLVIQGWPVSHGDIGSSSEHNLDNVISGIPAIASLFVIFLHVVGFWHVSILNIVIATSMLLAVVYDMLILGGAAAKINRLTDEIKPER